MGNFKANTAMKCTDQMPMPITTVPPVSQTTAARPSARATREARFKEVYDTTIAMTTERYTIQVV